MKKHALLFTMLFAFISCGLFAQQEKQLRYYQVGLNFSSLNSFGLHFKTGSEKTLLRASLLSLNLGLSSSQGRTQDSIDTKGSSYGAAFRIGFEKRIPVNSKLNFIWGLECGSNYTVSKQKSDQSGVYSDYEINSWSVSPTVDLVLGANYIISEHLVFGAEILPYIRYSFGKSKSTHYSTQTTEQTNNTFDFGFNSNSASLSIAYRFGK
jgi:hypothetical protein